MYRVMVGGSFFVRPLKTCGGSGAEECGSVFIVSVSIVSVRSGRVSSGGERSLLVFGSVGETESTLEEESRGFWEGRLEKSGMLKVKEVTAMVVRMDILEDVNSFEALPLFVLRNELEILSQSLMKAQTG